MVSLMVSPFQPFKNCLLNCHFVDLLDTSPVDSKARCLGASSFRWKSKRWGSNLSLLSEKLGVSSWLCVAMPKVGFTARLCLSLSYPF